MAAVQPGALVPGPDVTKKQTISMRETLLEGPSSDEVKKSVTNGLHMSVSETTERPASSIGKSVATFKRIRKNSKEF
jgi:hypothetical protein